MVLRNAFRFAAAVVTALLASSAAYAVDARALTGWWIAIDDTFPKLWEAGVAPVEEVLVINADGRFEDRVMNFLPGTAQVCAQRRVCADLVLLAYGRLRIAGETLVIGERGAPPNRLDTIKTDPLIRRAAMSSVTSWAITADQSQITLRSNGGMTRTFAKIEPRRLQRLRAGMRAAGLPPEKHWRCFLGNATAQQSAFAPLREQSGNTAKPGIFGFAAANPAERSSPPSPEWLDRYLRAASYLMTLDAMAKFPILEDPSTRPFIGSEPEQLLVEDFPGVTAPATRAETQRLNAQIATIEMRVRDKMKELAGGGPAPANAPRAAISDAEVAAFAFAASEDPEAKRMFCRD